MKYNSNTGKKGVVVYMINLVYSSIKKMALVGVSSVILITSSPNDSNLALRFFFAEP
jgi:hypothetical protein